MSFVILLHGGAGSMMKGPDAADGSNSSGSVELKALRRIVTESYHFALTNLVNQHIAAVDVAQYVAMLLENEPLFSASGLLCSNAFEPNQNLESDASLVDGRTGKFGAASCTKGVCHPVALARKVMELSPHGVLSGAAANAFAREHGLERTSRGRARSGTESDASLDAEFSAKRQRRCQDMVRAAVAHTNDEAHLTHDGPVPGGEEEQKHLPLRVGRKTAALGVVVHYKGSTAAACSAGNTTSKIPGRVGYASMPGCGSFADGICAVSVAGVGAGDQLIRHCAASSVAHRMRFGGESLREAARHTVYGDLPEGSAGLIVIDRAGRSAVEYNTRGMFRAQCRYSPPAQTNKSLSEWDQPADAASNDDDSGVTLTLAASPSDSITSSSSSSPIEGKLSPQHVRSHGNCFVAIWENEQHFTL